MIGMCDGPVAMIIHQTEVMAGMKEATTQSEAGSQAIQPRAPRRRAYARKDDIVLEAAERAFLQSGYANTSMDGVAELAGVSKRTVYTNFGSKQDLFAAVIRKRCADVVPRAPDSVDMLGDHPEEVLVKLATSFLRNVFSHPQVELYQTIVAESRQFPEFGRIMFEGPIMQSQRIFDEFLRAQAGLGHLTFPDIDQAAAQLIAILKTNVHMQLLFNQPAATSDREIAKSAAASVHLFLHGALSPEFRSGK